MHGFLDQLESTIQVAFPPVQQFCRAHECDRQTDHATLSADAACCYRH